MFAFAVLFAGCVQPPDLPPTATESLNESATEELADLATMSFVEKNGFYLQLLDEKQAKGADTALAESAYQQSVEASLIGDSQKADQALIQAIQYLLN